MVDVKRPVESYCRLYDDILENAKVAALSAAGFGLYCAMIVYCHRNDTDGAIPAKRARGLLNFTDSDYSATIAELRQVELVGGDDCLTVHDYLLHNSSHAERNAKRNANSNAARIRWSNAKAMPKVEGRREKGEGISNALNVEPDEGLKLAVLMEPLLGHALSAIDIESCRRGLSEYRYLTGIEHFAKRAGEHKLYCTARNLPFPKTVEGYLDSWRRENDYMADRGDTPNRAHIVGLTKAEFRLPDSKKTA